jgi:allantoin racemase
VLGIAEAAFHAESLLATGFSVLTTMQRTGVIAERWVLRDGFDRTCRGIHGTEIPVLALQACGEEIVAQIEDCARESLAHDRSGAIVLGCAGMATLCQTLKQRL